MKTFRFRRDRRAAALRIARLAGLGAATLAGLPAHAGEFPDRPIKIIVGFAPGGATDNQTREFARRLEKELGQAVLVENKPGGGGAIAMQSTLSGGADGYTLVMGSPAGFSIGPVLNRETAKYDPRRFVPIAPVTAQANVLVALPSFPASSIGELVALSKRKPLSYGSFGTATSAHLAMEILKKKSGLDAQHIPYRGDPPSLLAVKSGEIDVAVITMFSALPRIRSGELKGLGVLQAQPDRNLPRLQTTAQAGFPDIDLPSWIGLFAPPDTPKPVTDKLEAAARKVLAAPEFQRFAVESGNEPLRLDNKAFLALIERQSRTLGEVIVALKLQPE